MKQRSLVGKEKNCTLATNKRSSSEAVQSRLLVLPEDDSKTQIILALDYELDDLFGLGKTNSTLAKIVDRVVSAQESVTKNSQRTSGGREIHALEGGNAAA